MTPAQERKKYSLRQLNTSQQRTQTRHRIWHQRKSANSTPSVNWTPPNTAPRLVIVFNTIQNNTPKLVIVFNTIQNNTPKLIIVFNTIQDNTHKLVIVFEIF